MKKQIFNNVTIVSNYGYDFTNNLTVNELNEVINEFKMQGLNLIAITSIETQPDTFIQATTMLIQGNNLDAALKAYNNSYQDFTTALDITQVTSNLIQITSIIKC